MGKKDEMIKKVGGQFHGASFRGKNRIMTASDPI